MKKLLLLSLALGLLSFSPTTSNYSVKPNFEKNKSNVNCKYGQCKATAKSTGKQCKHCVSNRGDSYCWQHNK